MGETMKLAANLFAALLVLLAAQTVSAQSGYPNRPVKILVGFTPGTAPQGETVNILAMPEVRRKFDELGLEPVGNTPVEFAAVISRETPEWAKVIKGAGIKLGN
jgi:tripartite-type tricarboxylate transporter receptor subunit TctC